MPQFSDLIFNINFNLYIPLSYPHWNKKQIKQIMRMIN